MRNSLRVLLPGVVALAAAGGPAAGEPSATALAVVEPTFREPEVRVAMSMPPQFEVVFQREMPTPGWSFTVDAVEVDEEASRILARITEVAPEGISLQVITETACRVPLGKLEPGLYSFELWVRRGDEGPHVLTQSLVLRAR